MIEDVAPFSENSQLRRWTFLKIPQARTSVDWIAKPCWHRADVRMRQLSGVAKQDGCDPVAAAFHASADAASNRRRRRYDKCLKNSKILVLVYRRRPGGRYAQAGELKPITPNECDCPSIRDGAAWSKTAHGRPAPQIRPAAHHPRNKGINRRRPIVGETGAAPSFHDGERYGEDADGAVSPPASTFGSWRKAVT